MPVFLPAISRRKFLGRISAGGAGLALAPGVLAASRGTAEDEWALLSDIHLAADSTTIARGINIAKNLETVSREILSLPKRPSGVFITGDCAYHSGESGDYATMAELLKPIREDKMPVHLALGNHDNREHFWSALKEEKRGAKAVKGRQAALLRTPAANWFILDSLEKTLATPGLIGPEQLKWLAQTLDKNEKKPALVLVHHNPGTAETVGLKDTQAFLEVIRPRKQVKAYIYGHTHTWKVREDESGIHFINLPPVAYVFKEGQPSGWVHARLGNDGMRLELRCVDPQHQAHGQVVDLKWRV